MFIYIVRHAWAYHHGDSRWPDDSQRPLEEEGAKRFGRVVKALGARNFAPDVIAASPYVRCRQTADVIARLVDPSPDVVEFAALEPGSDFEALVEWSRQFEDRDAVCWVGHAPDVSRLAASLVGDASAAIRFAKGAVAAIRADGGVGPNRGELLWLATAKLLGV